MAVTRAGVVPANIQKARVLDVDVATYTLTAATEFAKKPLSGLSFMTPYQHSANGEGIYFMPEVGSLCWICEPSDGSMPFVLGWAAAQNEGDFRALKKDLNLGDLFMGTRDDNFLVLRRGGVVQVGATGLCQRIFLPVDNTIRDFCENYGLYTLGGELEWGISRTDTDTSGHLPAQLKLSAKQFADDPNAVAIMTLGSHHAQSDESTLFTLSIKTSGANGAAEKVSLKIDKDGQVSWTVQQDVNWAVQGDWDLEVKGSITEHASGNIDFEAKGNATLKGGATTTVEGDAGVTVKAPTTSVTGNLSVQGGLPVAIAPPLVTYLATHTHPIILAPAASPSPGNQTVLVTGPPATPPPASIVSKATTSV